MQETHTRLQGGFNYFATIKPLFKLAWQGGPGFLLGLFVMNIVQGLAPTANLLIMSALLDTLVQGMGTNRTERFVALLLALAGVNLLGQLLGYVESIVQNLYEMRVSNHVQLLVTEKASSLDLAFFESPEFFNQYRNATEQASFQPVAVITQMLSLVASVTSLGSALIILLTWQWWIIPIIVLVSLMQFRVSLRFGGARFGLFTAQAATSRKMEYFGYLLTGEQHVKEVRLFSLRDHFLDRFRRLLIQLYQENRRLFIRQLTHSGGVETILSFIQPLMLGFAGLQVLQGTISLGQFNLYTQSLGGLSGGLIGLMANLSQLHESNLFLTNLFRFLELQPEVEAPRPNSAQQLARISAVPHIEFRNVSFVYPDTDRRVLDDVSFHIYPGESVALVGENGSGKTTLIKLLTGLYEPLSGQILFDGIDITTLDRRDLRHLLGVIFQDHETYAFSAYDNIGIGAIDNIDDRDRVETAAKRSGVDQLVAGLPDGYDTPLSRHLEDGGVELSGGQRQLISLARALMRDAPILILDEPSAALDIYKEYRFFTRLFEEHQQGRQTVIFISHRFTTVRRAQRILVLEHGKLIEQGPHDELMMLNGRYAEMFKLQVDMYGMLDEEPESSLDHALAAEGAVNHV
jgi:ATP-binding cassette subfamily B protein